MSLGLPSGTNELIGAKTPGCPRPPAQITPECVMEAQRKMMAKQNKLEGFVNVEHKEPEEQEKEKTELMATPSEGVEGAKKENEKATASEGDDGANKKKEATPSEGADGDDKSKQKRKHGFIDTVEYKGRELDLCAMTSSDEEVNSRGQTFRNWCLNDMNMGSTFVSTNMNKRQWLKTTRSPDSPITESSDDYSTQTAAQSSLPYALGPDSPTD